MRRVGVGEAGLLALALGACAGPPPVPRHAPVSAPATGGAGLSLKAVQRALREGLEQVPPEELVTRVQTTLARQGAATITVPHERHTHHYVLTWVAGVRTLVFFERTGDGVERLQAWTLDVGR